MVFVQPPEDEKQVECMVCHRTIPQRESFEVWVKATNEMSGYLCADDAPQMDGQPAVTA